MMPARSEFVTPSGPIAEIAFCGWLGQASPGDMLMYHRGHLGLDVVPQVSRLPAAERAELVRLARRAMWAAEQGLVHLLQRRHRPDDYAYLAVARPRSGRSAASLSELLAMPLA